MGSGKGTTKRVSTTKSVNYRRTFNYDVGGRLYGIEYDAWEAKHKESDSNHMSVVEYYLKSKEDINNEKKASYVMTELLHDVMDGYLFHGPSPAKIGTNGRPITNTLKNYKDYAIKVRKNVTRKRSHNNGRSQTNVYQLIYLPNNKKVFEHIVDVNLSYGPIVKRPLINKDHKMVIDIKNYQNKNDEPLEIIAFLLREGSDFDY